MGELFTNYSEADRSFVALSETGVADDMIKNSRICSFFTKNGYGLLFPTDAENVQVSNLHSMRIQGMSNRMRVFSIAYTSRKRVFRRVLVMRIYRNQSREKLSREYRALKMLKAKGIPVPEALMLEADGRAVGEPFMVMEKINGVSASYFLDNDENALSTVDMLARLLASLHTIEPTTLFPCGVSKSELAGTLEFRESILSQVRRRISLGYITSLSPLIRSQYLKAITRLEMTKVQPSRLTLIHGDFGPDHVLLTQNGPVIVDWEGIRVGDPAYDVGWVYHIIRIEGQAMIDHRFVRVPNRASISFDLGEEFLKHYEHYSGSEPVNLGFYKDLAAIKLATILDLHVRPGAFFLDRLLRLPPKEILSQTVFARGTIKSVKNYCESFLQERNILSKRN